MMGLWDAVAWTICKQSAPRSRQITTSTPQKNHSIFTGWMLFLTPNQQCQSTEGTFCEIYLHEIFFALLLLRML